MNIIYLTTSLQPDDYSAWAKSERTLPNPSNQNFHSRLIQALMKNDKVEVLSLIPSKSSKTLVLDSRNYTYINRSKEAVFFFDPQRILYQRGLSLFQGLPTIIVYDSMNVHLGNAARHLARKRHCPCVAVITDNPDNLSDCSSFYRRLVLRNIKKSNAFFSLSQGLLCALHVEEKPSVVFEGVVEEEALLPIAFPKRSYLYFGGSIKERYGIQNLVNAYLRTKPDYDLVIAGHSDRNAVPFQAALSYPRVHFLGQVDARENASLQAGAALLVNPRPYDEVLDKQSVPSKMLEYLMSGSPILSTNHTRLRELFPNDVNWLEGSDEQTIEKWFANHLDPSGKFINLIQNEAKSEVFARYSEKAIGDRVHAFLQSLS